MNEKNNDYRQYDKSEKKYKGRYDIKTYKGEQDDML